MEVSLRDEATLAAMTAPSLTVTHTSTVTPEQIDDLGHMNVRWYGANATAASTAVCDRLGVSPDSIISTYTRHHQEQMEGSSLEVRSALLGGGGDLRLYHELRNAETDDLAATFVHQFAHESPSTDGIELPDYGKPRTLDLGTDGIASAPSLATLQARGLAMRTERLVTEEDTAGATVVPPWLTYSLIWGGERPAEWGGDESWIVTAANGDELDRLPALGTRIQSFGAIIMLGEKISHDVSWTFDLDTGELLVAFEGIDLAFNITQRKSTAITPELRVKLSMDLHPDLAPSVPGSSLD